MSFHIKPLVSQRVCLGWQLSTLQSSPKSSAPERPPQLLSPHAGVAHCRPVGRSYALVDQWSKPIEAIVVEPPKSWNLKSNSKIAGNSCAILGLLYLMTNSWKVNVNIWWELYSQYTVYSIHIVRSWGSFFNLGHHQWFAQKGVTAESETLSSSLSIFEVLFWGPSGTPALLNSRGYSTVRVPFTRK